MTTRRFAAALLAAPLLLGLVACSSDEPESSSTSAGSSDDGSDGTTGDTADLSDVPVEDICTSLGVVYDWLEGASAIGGEYPAIRDYIAAETPAAIEALGVAAEESPDDLAEALTTLADRMQTNFDAGNAAATESDYMALLATPDSEADAAFVVINEFSDPECGFTFTTA